ncbi:MAG: NADH-quinone oxidoreductase subunit J [Planctomycetota bacterium]
MIQALFIALSGFGLLMALGTVFARNLVHAGLYLVAFFFVVACQFVLLEAEFMAAIQVLIYIGAVAVLLMFGIMLTRNIQGDDTTIVTKQWRLLGLGAFGSVLVVLILGINSHEPWTQLAVRPEFPVDATTNTERGRAILSMTPTVGREMMTRYVVPFELAGLLLTAALVGAVVLAQYDNADEAEALAESAKPSATQS